MKTKQSNGKHARPDRGGDFSKFDIDDPKLPSWIAESALTSGHYPYDKRLKAEPYERDLRMLQIELLKLQNHMREGRERLVVVFEGRDAAGKGGAIAAFTEHLNPRHAFVAALTKPTELEAGQWYFQRYVECLPSAGDIVLFDRSWYNRAGVERVMGFCTKQQTATFLREAPVFEGMLVRDGITLVKLFLSVSRETQLKRLHTRHHDPLKQWKLSPIDIEGLTKWDDYTAAQREMFRATHTEAAPWTVIRSNDKLRARLGALRSVLSRMDYKDKDEKAVGKPDPAIIGSGPEFFETA